MAGRIEGYLATGQRPDPAYWENAIRGGLKFREKMAYEGEWADYLRWYRDDWEVSLDEADTDNIRVNLYFTTVRSIIPRLYYRDPTVAISPLKPGMEHLVLAKIMERLDTKLIRQMRLKDTFKDMITNTILFGTGIASLGYSSENSFSHLGTVDHSARANGENLEYNSQILEGMPWIRPIDPGDYIVPYGTDRLHAARWTATIIRRNYQDVRKDSRYSEARRQVKPGRFFGSSNEKLSADAKASPGTNEYTSDMVELLTIRDKKTRRVFIIAPNQLVLLDTVDMLQEDGYPEFAMIFNPSPRCFWGVPDARILKVHQRELNAVRNQIAAHRRSSTWKILAKQGALKTTEKEKLLSGATNSIIETEGMPAGSIEQLKFGGIDSELFDSLELTMRDAREAVGFSRNQRGEYNSSTAETTATEAQIVNAAAEIRMDERRDVNADIMVDMLRQVNKLIARKWSSEQIMDIVGPGGVPVWLKYTPSVLKPGDFDIHIDPDESLPETKERREARALALYQQLATNPLVDPIRLTQYLLHSFHGTQFDDMMRVLPQQEGADNSPMSPEQYGEMVSQQMQQANPESLAAMAAQGSA